MNLNSILCLEALLLAARIAIHVNPNPIILCARNAQCTLNDQQLFAYPNWKQHLPYLTPLMLYHQLKPSSFLNHWGSNVIEGIERNARPKLCISPWVKYNCQSLVDQLANIKAVNWRQFPAIKTGLNPKLPCKLWSMAKRQDLPQMQYLLCNCNLVCLLRQKSDVLDNMQNIWRNPSSYPTYKS